MRGVRVWAGLATAAVLTGCTTSAADQGLTPALPPVLARGVVATPAVVKDCWVPTSAGASRSPLSQARDLTTSAAQLGQRKGGTERVVAEAGHRGRPRCPDAETAVAREAAEGLAGLPRAPHWSAGTRAGRSSRRSRAAAA